MGALGGRIEEGSWGEMAMEMKIFKKQEGKE